MEMAKMSWKEKQVFAVKILDDIWKPEEMAHVTNMF